MISEDPDDDDDLAGLFSTDAGIVSEQFLAWIASLEEEGYETIDILAGMNFATCDLLSKLVD